MQYLKGMNADPEATVRKVDPSTALPWSPYPQPTPEGFEAEGLEATTIAAPDSGLSAEAKAEIAASREALQGALRSNPERTLSPSAQEVFAAVQAEAARRRSLHANPDAAVRGDIPSRFHSDWSPAQTGAMKTRSGLAAKTPAVREMRVQEAE